MNLLTNNEIKSCLKQRELLSNKSDHGHAFIIAGRKGVMGSAVIAARSCLRSGVGLLTVCVPVEERNIVQNTVPEAMVLMREDDPNLEGFSAIGIGPGMGTDEASEERLVSMLVQSRVPLVLDADALTIIARNKKRFGCIPENTIITPHTGEFDRLFGVHKTNEARIKTARIKAAEYRIMIVLKGPETAIISAGEIWYNTTGNAGLAKGGSGDALTGIITSFLAQGYDPIIAAKIAVYFHGLAADLTLNQQSMESMLITDVIENFGKTFEMIRNSV
ncbi:MAG: NAD(P)H-hydrate dehydratase [Fluviicola sp.]